MRAREDEMNVGIDSKRRRRGKDSVAAYGLNTGKATASTSLSHFSTPPGAATVAIMIDQRLRQASRKPWSSDRARRRSVFSWNMALK